MICSSDDLENAARSTREVLRWRMARPLVVGDCEDVGRNLAGLRRRAGAEGVADSEPSDDLESWYSVHRRSLAE